MWTEELTEEVNRFLRSRVDGVFSGKIPNLLLVKLVSVSSFPNNEIARL